MNYYNPNLYQNYPYTNNQYTNPYTVAASTPPQLNGKMVDSEDMVRVTEVPIGGYGIFPKADLSEVYIKTWNPNGTTSVMTFKPTTQAEVQPEKDNYIDILEKIQNLENKLDAVLHKTEDTSKTQKPKKEMNINGF